MMKNKIFLLLSALAFLHSALSAGVVYTLITKDLQKADDSGEMTVSVDGKNLKMEFAGGMGDKGSMVFLGNENSMMMIDHERRQYVLMDGATINKLGNQMNEALKNVPPEQRAMVGKMMNTFSQGGTNPMMASMDQNMFKQLKELGGFPVSSINYQNGKPSEESTLKSVEKRDLDKSTFAAPKGYKKQRMDGR